MVCNIHSFVEVRENSKWKKVEDSIFEEEEIFPNRSYALFGFLADVRNYSKVPGFKTRGIPDDSEYLNEDIGGGKYTRIEDLVSDGYHSYSHLSLKDLMDFNYHKKFIDQRVNGKISFEERSIVRENKDEIDRSISIGEFLENTGLLRSMAQLAGLGKPEDVRIVFYFDN